MENVKQAMQPLALYHCTGRRMSWTWFCGDGELYGQAAREKQTGTQHNGDYAEKAKGFGERFMSGKLEASKAVLCAEDHLGLVHLCANRFRNRGIGYEELYSAGCYGLVKAVKAFDQSRSVQFSTYAVPVILGEIKRLFRDGGIIHMSRSLRERAMQLQKLREQMEQQMGRSPTLSELSRESGETPEDVAELFGVMQTPLSLNYSDEEGNDGQIEIPVEAEDGKIGDILSLRQGMKMLPEKDRKLLELRYFREMTQTETARILGMTQVQVSRREKKLLLQLREFLNG